MYLEDIGMFLIGMAVSTSLLTFFMFLGNFLLTCFEMPGQTRIPKDKWRENKKI